MKESRNLHDLTANQARQPVSRRIEHHWPGVAALLVKPMQLKDAERELWKTASTV